MNVCNTINLLFKEGTIIYVDRKPLFCEKNQIWQKPEPTTLHSIIDKTVEKSPVLADCTSTRSILQPFSKRVDFRYIRQFTFVNDFQSRLLYNIENECITQAAIEMFCLSLRLLSLISIILAHKTRIFEILSLVSHSYLTHVILPRMTR